MTNSPGVDSARGDPSRRARLEQDALQRHEAAAQAERASVNVSGLIVAGSLSALGVTLIGPQIPEMWGGLPVLAGVSACLLWLPITWAIRAVDRWQHPPLPRSRLEKAFHQYMDLHYPLDPPQYGWQGSTLNHPVFHRQGTREAALTGFAGGAIRSWHFYLAVSLALAAWIVLTWSSPGEHAPRAALVFQMAAFLIAYLVTRAAAWLFVRPCLPPPPVRPLAADLWGGVAVAWGWCRPVFKAVGRGVAWVGAQLVRALAGVGKHLRDSWRNRHWVATAEPMQVDAGPLPPHVHERQVEPVDDQKVVQPCDLGVSVAAPDSLTVPTGSIHTRPGPRL